MHYRTTGIPWIVTLARPSEPEQELVAFQLRCVNVLRCLRSGAGPVLRELSRLHIEGQACICTADKGGDYTQGHPYKVAISVSQAISYSAPLP